MFHGSSLRRLVLEAEVAVPTHPHEAGRAVSRQRCLDLCGGDVALPEAYDDEGTGWAPCEGMVNCRGISLPVPCDCFCWFHADTRGQNSCRGYLPFPLPWVAKAVKAEALTTG
jgi:hypothetical protein